MKAIVDRIEANIIVLETDKGGMANMDLILLPHVKEGDVVEIKINTEETAARKILIKKKMDNLFID